MLTKFKILVFVEFLGFPSVGNGSHLLPGRHCSWSNSYHPEPPSMMWPNSPAMVNGIYAARPSAQLHGLPTAHTLNNTGVPVINYHVGSAPTVNPSLWDRRHAYGGESPKASSFHPGSLGSMRGSSNFPYSMELKSRNIFPYVGENCIELTLSLKKCRTAIASLKVPSI